MKEVIRPPPRPGACAYKLFLFRLAPRNGHASAVAEAYMALGYCAYCQAGSVTNTSSIANILKSLFSFLSRVLQIWVCHQFFVYLQTFPKVLFIVTLSRKHIRALIFQKFSRKWRVCDPLSLKISGKSVP